MDVAGALLPFTQVVRPELTIHVQEVLTQADKVDVQKKVPIPSLQINEPTDDVSPVKSYSDTVIKSPVKKDVNVLKNGRKGNPA